MGYSSSGIHMKPIPSIIQKFGTTRGIVVNEQLLDERRDFNAERF
jgi:hypothetical protein